MSSSTRTLMWVATRLSAIAHVIRGRVNPQDHPEMPFVGMENVEAHTMRLIGTVPSSTMKSASVHFLPGDVLYGRLRPYLNKILAPEFEGLASAEFIPLTTPDGVLPVFLQYRLNAADFVTYASHLDEGDRPRVDYDQIGAFEIELPPSGEQRRIIEAIESYLSRLDDAMATLERVQRNLKRYRASVLKAAVEGTLVPTEAELARAEGRDYEPASALLERILAERRRRWEESELAKIQAKGKPPKDDKWKAKYTEPVGPDVSDLPELPEGWCWASIEQVGETVTGTTPPTKEASYYGEEVPFFKPTDLDAGYNVSEARRYLSRVGMKHARLLPINSVLVTCIGATIGKTGLARVLCTTNQQINSLIPDELIRSTRYLFWYLSSPAGQGAVISNSSSTTLPILNKRRFELLPVPLPPIAEQERIVEEVDRLFSVISSLSDSTDHELLRLARLRQSILKWAFEGRLVDQDPNDEPASKLLERIRAEREAESAQPSRNRRRARTAKERP